MPVEASLPSSIGAWDDGMRDLLMLRGDPIGTLAVAIENDPLFVLGRVVRVAALTLGGAPANHPTVMADLVALESSGDVAGQLVHGSRKQGQRERGHCRAVRELVAGNFSKAADAWESVIDAWPRDLAAIRLAHDVYLHTGNDHARLASSQRAIGAFAPGEPGFGIVLGHLAFAHEEVGAYDAAIEAANRAMAIDASDVWARHAAAHVHEMRGDSAALYAVLDPDGPWPAQELLASHLWWHRGIRLVADGRVDEALAVADRLPADSDAAFTLSDLTSLLVRLEQRGIDVGVRWERVIEAWRNVTNRHTCGFLDLHAALAGLADPELGAEWHASQVAIHRPPVSQNDALFVEVVEPLTSAVLALRGTGRTSALDKLAALSGRIAEIGGSLAQRQVIDIAAGVAVLPAAPTADHLRPSTMEPNR